MVGAKITEWVRRMFYGSKQPKQKSAEQEPLLGQHKTVDDEIAPEDEPSVVAEPPPRVRDVLNFQVVLNMVVYFLLAFYSLAYDQVGQNPLSSSNTC